jgi:hypothetical protein
MLVVIFLINLIKNTFVWSIQKQANKYLIFNKLAKHIKASGASMFNNKMAVKNDMP